MDMLYAKLNKKLDSLQKSRNKSTPKPDDQNHTTFPRTVNLTRITFMEEEQKLLDLGLQFSILKPLPSIWTNLTTETVRAVKLLDDKLQDSIRSMAAKKLKQLCKCSTHNHTKKRQWHILKQIKQKISHNNALITQADKGKTTVIIYSHDYYLYPKFSRLVPPSI
jgi:hypothetical protein